MAKVTSYGQKASRVERFCSVQPGYHHKHGPIRYNEGAWVAVTPHGVLPRDSHEISPTIGGVHKLMILLRDVLNEKLQKTFGEEIGGARGTQTPLL